MMGFEPTAPRTTTWCSNQLSYTHRGRARAAKRTYQLPGVRAKQDGYSEAGTSLVCRAAISRAVAESGPGWGTNTASR